MKVINPGKMVTKVLSDFRSVEVALCAIGAGANALASSAYVQGKIDTPEAAALLAISFLPAAIAMYFTDTTQTSSSPKPAQPTYGGVSLSTATNHLSFN